MAVPVTARRVRARVAALVTAVLALALGARSASVAVRIEPSLEWLALSSHGIVIARIAQYYDQQREGGKRLFEARTNKELWGEPTPSFTFELALPENPPQQEDEFLVFLDDRDSVTAAIDLLEPRAWKPGALTSGFDVLRTRERILEATGTLLERRHKEKALRKTGAPPVVPGFPPQGSLWLPVPERSAVSERLGGPAYLTVPAERRFRRAFLDSTRSRDMFTRARYAFRLAQYPGSDTEKALKRLLADPGAMPVPIGAAPSLRGAPFSPARHAAWWSLRELGIDAPAPPGCDTSEVFYLWSE
jgi:hypothetical protein